MGRLETPRSRGAWAQVPGRARRTDGMAQRNCRLNAGLRGVRLISLPRSASTEICGQAGQPLTGCPPQRHFGRLTSQGLREGRRQPLRCQIASSFSLTPVHRPGCAPPKKLSHALTRSRRPSLSPPRFALKQSKRSISPLAFWFRLPVAGALPLASMLPVLIFAHAESLSCNISASLPLSSSLRKCLS